MATNDSPALEVALAYYKEIRGAEAFRGFMGPFSAILPWRTWPSRSAQPVAPSPSRHTPP